MSARHLSLRSLVSCQLMGGSGVPCSFVNQRSHRLACLIDLTGVSSGLGLSDIAIACHHVTLEPSDALETNRTVCCAGPPKDLRFHPPLRSHLVASRSLLPFSTAPRSTSAQSASVRAPLLHNPQPPAAARRGASAAAGVRRGRCWGGRGRWCGTPIRRGRCRGRPPRTPPRTPHTDWGPAPRESSRAAVAGRCCAR